MAGGHGAGVCRVRFLQHQESARRSVRSSHHPLWRTTSIGTALGLAAVVLLVLATGFFVAAEFAVLAVDRSRLELLAQTGSRRARTALAVHRRLSFHLSGAQLGLTVVSLILGFVAEPTIARVIEPLVDPFLSERTAKGVSVGIALSIASVLSMVVGELIPKNLVLATPERSALLLAGPLRVFSLVLGPLITMSNGTANAIVRRLGIEPKEELESVRSLSELEQLIRSSGEEGTLETQKLNLLTRSIGFRERTAAAALVPRPRVEAISGDATVADLVGRSVATGYSRFPVIAADLDDVLGVVHVKDVYGLAPQDRAATSVRLITKEALAVPETRLLEELFGDLRREASHMAIVVDEHGGTAGIVTLEDLLEEIVGEIDDEHDSPVTGIRVEPSGAWNLDGTLHLHEVEEATGFRPPDGEYDTIAGFVLDRLGHLPEPGERVTEGGWTVEVCEMDRHRIASVRVSPTEHYRGGS